MSCVFCQIVAGQEPAEIVRDDNDVLIFRPLNPVTPGHLLVVPYIHVPDAATDPVVTGAVYAEAARYARSTGQSFNLITNAGRVATQTVFHLHVHYVPRREDDGLRLPWSRR